MSTSFQQQSPDRNLNLWKTAPKPQHGCKSEPGAAKAAIEPRSFEPRPGRS